MPTIRTSTLLDRMAHLRSDATHLEGLATAPDARFLALINGHVLIRSNDDRTEAGILWLRGEQLASCGLLPNPATRLFLGAEPVSGAARFAALLRVPEPPPGESLRIPALPGALVEARSLAMQGIMSADELSLAAQALTIANWRANARFCGRCGAANATVDGGWKMQCSACDRETFPRIDPVVIMLIEDGDRCVLSREARFPEGMLSTLAGFIEPGEDIMHAVARETREEIGVETAAVRFIASQPWPFPHSLMIGCIARAATTELRPDPTEILEARWYDRSQVAELIARKPGPAPWLPGRQSLANLLVRTWLQT